MKNTLIVKGKKAVTSRLYYKTADLSHPWGSVKENFQTALQKMVDNPKRFVIIKEGTAAPMDREGEGWLPVRRKKT